MTVTGQLLDGLTPEYADEFASKNQLPELLVHNPLSNPKGVSYNCEICSRESHLQCSLCKRTYYCCAEHQEMDWNSVHSKICPYIAALRAPPPVLHTQEERSMRTEQVKNTKIVVLTICKNEALRHLQEQHPDLAHPAGLQALRYAADVYGNTSLELVPPYLLLTEANIAAQIFDKAQEHLCQAKWILIQHPNASPSFKCQLSRNFGKLCLAQRKYDKALKHFASDAYYTSQIKGPDHIDTATPLYYMGTTFIDKGDHESAVALFEKVHSVWTPFLQECLKPVFDGGEVKLPPDWTQSTATNADQILKKIVEAQKEMHGHTQIAVAQALFAHGLLKCVTGDWREAFKLLAQASQMFDVTAGSEHSLTRNSQIYLALAQKKKAISFEDEDDGFS